MTPLVDTSVWSLTLRRDGTVDALLIQLCGRHDLTLLSTDTDQDFAHAAQHVPFKLWRP